MICGSEMGNNEAVLVTGYCGRIGRILMNGLASSFDLSGIDKDGVSDGASLYRANISEYGELSRVFDSLPPIKYVVHLAAQYRHHADWNDVLRNNIEGTRNVYEACRKKGGIKRIVFASSNHVTGRYEFINGSDVPNLHFQENPSQIDVNSPVRPDGYYGISKVTGEAIARYFYDKYRIESVCLRIGTVTEKPGGPSEERHLSTWLSYRDLLQLVEKSLSADRTFPGFGIYYGVSNNTRSFWSIDNARHELGYAPEDNADEHWKPFSNFG